MGEEKESRNVVHTNSIVKEVSTTLLGGGLKINLQGKLVEFLGRLQTYREYH